MTNAIENARKALDTYREDGSNNCYADMEHALNLAVALRDLLKVVEKARMSEERTHMALNDRKPTRDDSSQTWRILSGVES